MKKYIVRVHLVFIMGVIFACTATAFAQSGRQPIVKELTLFDTKITINIYEYRTRQGQKSPITFVSLHHDEDISLKAAKSVVEARGGKLIEVVSIKPNSNVPRRLMHFKVSQSDLDLCIDPNRIFSLDGIEKTLKKKNHGEGCQNGTDDANALLADAVGKVNEFAIKLLNLFMREKRCKPTEPKEYRMCANELLVAVHNNTNFEDSPEGISSQSFLRMTPVVGGRRLATITGDEFKNTQGAYIQNRVDEDEFLMVSNYNLFKQLMNFSDKDDGNDDDNEPRRFSIGIQKQRPDKSDGYLSVWSAYRKYNYIIVETEDTTSINSHKLMLNRIVDVFGGGVKTTA